MEFDWKDEDPGALIVLVFALVAVLFIPWHSCSSVKVLQGNPAQKAMSTASQGPSASTAKP